MRLYHPEDRGARAAAALRWGAAGLLVATLHAGLGWWVVRTVAPTKPPDTVQGIPIDLEPVAAPVNTPEPVPTAAGGPAPTPQSAAAPDLPQPMPPEPTASAEPPRPEAPTPDPPQAAPPPLDPQPAPEPPQTQFPEAEVPPPAPHLTSEPPPTPPKRDAKPAAVLSPPPKPPRPDPRAVAREAARRKAEAEKRAEQRVAHAEARAQARADRTAADREAGGPGSAAAAPGGVASGAAVATWRGAVQAHLRAFTPSGTGSSGIARVSFSVDRAGRVVSAALAGSSGDAGLDSAAVAMVRRASPMPAPPPELGGRVSLSVPVRFQ